MKKHKLEDVLNLKKQTISILNTKEMNKAQGGFTSIGHACSERNSCDRVCCNDTLATSAHHIE